MLMRAAIGIIGLVLMSGMAYSIMDTNNANRNGSLGEQNEFTYEVVTDPVAQEHGLSGRKTIPPDYGMLFVLQNPAMPGFWMKDMLTAIDIIWLNEKGIIVGIEKSVSPRSYPKAFYPPQPVLYVLETRTGESVRRNWTVGTKLTLPESSQN